MPDRRSYAFIRREMPNFDMMRSAGWNTPLFAYDDPRLADQIARARSAGVQYGIWGDPGKMSAEDFARHMAGIRQRYQDVSVIAPDIEFIGKGYEGSQGWAYNQALARAWQQYLPGMDTALTVMPNQRDFNYEAWKGIAGEWLPQAYGADPTKHVFDPEQIAQTLIARGVDPSIITPVLGPGHGDHWNNYRGNTALWTFDDFMINGLPQYYGQRQTQAARPPSSEQPAAPTPQVGRLSQSAAQIQNRGLLWGGNTFTDLASFKRSIKNRPGGYKRWAEQHPTAAAALEGR